MIQNRRRDSSNPCPAIPCVAAIIFAATAVACGSALGPNVGSGGAGFHTVSVAVSGSGTVRSSTVSIDCGATCTATVSDGTVVTLIATPANDAHFAGWSGSCSGTNPCTLQANGDLSVGARFVSAPPPPVPLPSPADECAGLVPAALPEPVLAVVGLPDQGQGGCQIGRAHV